MLHKASMELSGWDQRYRNQANEESQQDAQTPLLVETAKSLLPGKALDLACGTGRNALWLAEQGWQVTAVDGAPSAIAKLQEAATNRKLEINTAVADLEKGEFQIAPSAWDFTAICFYLQRDLLAPAKEGVVLGGTILVIVHITEPGEEPTAHRLRPGELRNYFSDWEIVFYREGKPGDPAHKRAAAELVARRPG